MRGAEGRDTQSLDVGWSRSLNAPDTSLVVFLTPRDADPTDRSSQQTGQSRPCSGGVCRAHGRGWLRAGSSVLITLRYSCTTQRHTAQSKLWEEHQVLPTERVQVVAGILSKYRPGKSRGHGCSVTSTRRYGLSTQCRLRQQCSLPRRESRDHGQRLSA